MCESHIIYQLCGHVKIKTIVQCADTTEKMVASKSQISYPHQLCADVSDNSHIFPDICDKCQQNGVIGGVLKQLPGMKLEILQGWKKQHNSAAASESRSDATRDSRDAENDSESEKIEEIEQLETLEVLRVSDVASTGQTAAARERAPDLGSINNRIAALKDRTERLLSRIRVHKTSRASSSTEEGQAVE
ncbi:hypothetical protein LTS15_009044 [Exophiala xenobiotica]|nr:hypothetical protein LTS15_009044 [Exophiala xenobiotica]